MGFFAAASSVSLPNVTSFAMRDVGFGACYRLTLRLHPAGADCPPSLPGTGIKINSTKIAPKAEFKPNPSCWWKSQEAGTGSPPPMGPTRPGGAFPGVGGGGRGRGVGGAGVLGGCQQLPCLELPPRQTSTHSAQLRAGAELQPWQRARAGEPGSSPSRSRSGSAGRRRRYGVVPTRHAQPPPPPPNPFFYFAP